MVRQGLAAILVRGLGSLVIDEAADGFAALNRYRAARPDAVLLDLSLPVLDGLQVLERLRAIDPEVRALIVTTYDTDEDVRRTVSAGARGYLLKDAAPEQIVAAVGSVLAGGRYLPAAIESKLASAAATRHLTLREHQVLEHLARGASQKAVAKALAIGEGTVKTHMRALYDKLGATNRTQALAEAARRGLFERQRR